MLIKNKLIKLCGILPVAFFIFVRFSRYENDLPFQYLGMWLAAYGFLLIITIVLVLRRRKELDTLDIVIGVIDALLLVFLLLSVILVGVIGRGF